MKLASLKTVSRPTIFQCRDVIFDRMAVDTSRKLFGKLMKSNQYLNDNYSNDDDNYD